MTVMRSRDYGCVDSIEDLVVVPGDITQAMLRGQGAGAGSSRVNQDDFSLRPPPREHLEARKVK